MKKLCILILAVISVFLLVSCAEKLKENQVSYANNITENMLIGINKDDYQKYTQDANQKFKDVVNENQMKQSNKAISDKIGDYVAGSKVFEGASRTSSNRNKYITVMYNSKFTNETGNVIITVTFDDNDKHQVAGILFNSEKLRKK